jgi:hypothetical protein
MESKFSECITTIINTSQKTINDIINPRYEIATPYRKKNKSFEITDTDHLGDIIFMFELLEIVVNSYNLPKDSIKKIREVCQTTVRLLNKYA